MLEKSFSLLFYLKKPKNYLKCVMPIYLRITVHGIPKEISTGRQFDPDRWNANAGRVYGKLTFNTVTKIKKFTKRELFRSMFYTHNSSQLFIPVITLRLRLVQMKQELVID
jgi:hypothetical protein